VTDGPLPLTAGAALELVLALLAHPAVATSRTAKVATSVLRFLDTVVLLKVG
jgi:hypothetical protein